MATRAVLVVLPTTAMAAGVCTPMPVPAGACLCPPVPACARLCLCLCPRPCLLCPCLAMPACCACAAAARSRLPNATSHTTAAVAAYILAACVWLLVHRPPHTHHRRLIVARLVVLPASPEKPDAHAQPPSAHIPAAHLSSAARSSITSDCVVNTPAQLAARTPATTRPRQPSQLSSPPGPGGGLPSATFALQHPILFCSPSHPIPSHPHLIPRSLLSSPLPSPPSLALPILPLARPPPAAQAAPVLARAIALARPSPALSAPPCCSFRLSA